MEITKENRSLAIGRYFGYPTCCIKSFFDSDRLIIPSNYTGFIPCKEHAKQVIDGEITLESLIQNRKCELPFPQQPNFSIELLNEILEKYSE